MDPCDMVDSSEEPGFPGIGTTPRSIRNMENLIAQLEVPAAQVALESPTGSLSPHSPRLVPPPGSPRDLSGGSPRKAKSMTGRDVWHLGKGTAGPRSYGSFSKVSRDKWDSSRPGGETVWDQILKSEKAKETKT